MATAAAAIRAACRYTGRYAISSGVTATENDEDRAERNERNIPDGLYVRGCFR